MHTVRSASSVLLLCLAACSDRAGNDAVGSAGGTMVITVPGSGVSSLLSPIVLDATGRAVSDQVFERLAEIGPDLNTFGDRGFQPRLARSWTWSPDSLSVAFSLDPRAKWQDGPPVRANDVRFSFALAKDPKTGSPVTPLIANIDSVSVRDSLTAVVWFHRRSPEQFYDFAYQVYIVPEHLLRDIPRDKLATSEFAQQHPIGSGPFRFVRLDPGVRMELVADTTYYRGRPKLDRVVWSFASDASSAVTQLLSGQADFYETVPADVLPRIDSAGSVRAFRYPGLQYSFLGMNARDPKRPGAPHPVFGDARVRRAFSMALDRAAMLRNVFDTLGILGIGPYPRVLADTGVMPPPFDRAHAAALLDSAGWRAGPDGMRAKGSRALAITLSVPTSSRPRMRYAVLIQDQLKAVGARVDIESLDFNAFVNDRQESRNFDAALLSFSVDPNRAGLRQYWSAASIVKGGSNYVNYSSRTFDALLDSSLATFDQARADQYYRRAIQTLVNDAPGVWLYDVLTIAGAHKRLHPEGIRADGWWHALDAWSIPASERIERDRIGLRPAQP